MSGMRGFVKVLAAILAVAASVPGWAAEVPWVLNFSGRLGSAAGDFAGTTTITVSLYDHATASDPANLLWSDTVDVFVDAGRFHLLLGADPSNPILPTVLGAAELFVGVRVGDDVEMLPRVRVTSVPFALRADDANTLGGQGPDAFSPGGHTHDFAQVQGIVALTQLPSEVVVRPALDAILDAILGAYIRAGQQDSVDGGMVADGSLGLADLGDSRCGDRQVAKWDVAAGAWQCADDLDSRYSGADFARSGTTCAGFDKVAGIDGTGGLVCAPDRDSTFVAGAGLTLSGSVFSLDEVALLAATDTRYYRKGQVDAFLGAKADAAHGHDGTYVRVPLGGCPAGTLVQAVAADGTLTCTADANGGGTVTQIATGEGLTGGPITGTGTIAIAPGGVGNDLLANPAVTVVAGPGLSGGGLAVLGGSVSLAVSAGGITSAMIEQGTVTTEDISGAAGIRDGQVDDDITAGRMRIEAGGQECDAGATGSFFFGEGAAIPARPFVCDGTAFEGLAWLSDVTDESARAGQAELGLGARIDQLDANLNGRIDQFEELTVDYFDYLQHEALLMRADMTSLQNGLGTEIARAQAAEGGLQMQLADETVRAQGAENGLLAQVVAESGRAQGAESDLQAALTNEGARAQTVETGLQAQLTALEGSFAIEGSVLDLHAGGHRALRLDGNSAISPNLIGGFDGNTTASIHGATIAGGGSAADPQSANGSFTFVGGGAGNSAAGEYSTIGGGRINAASGTWATVGGGYSNLARSNGSTVCGGYQNLVETGNYGTVAGGQGNKAQALGASVLGGSSNTASGSYSAVGGGTANNATGNYATIPGGALNTATSYAFAAGSRAKASQQGCFVWGDSTDADVNCNLQNLFLVRSQRMYFGTGDGPATMAADTYLGTSTGASLTSGGTWTNNSDRNAKDGVVPVDGRDVLDRLAAMPISTWRYKAEGASVRHMGPMAQDFAAAFGLGSAETSIGTVDADGVALAAIQGLYGRLRDLQWWVEERLGDEALAGGRIAALEQENAELRKRLESLEARLARIEAGTR